MDLQSAVNAHIAWRMRFRSAMTKKERLDAATIGSPAQCDLGKWLGGEGRAKYGALSEFAALLRCHEEFHRAAGRVAEAVNGGDYPKAESMLESGTPYTQASLDVAKAVLSLQQRAT
jgi:methyl-accepting chemotaxis protein